MNIKTRILLFFCAMTLLSPAAGAAQKFPALTGRVVDNAHVLDQTTVDSLTAQLETAEKDTGAQIVVVTLPSLDGQEIEEYGYRLGRAWGIGQKGRNDGVLLIVAPKEHKTRIEVGYGLEGQLTDAVCSTIINSSMIPFFRQGDYSGGIANGAQKIIKVLGGETETVEDSIAPAITPDQASHFSKGIGFIDLLFFAFVLYSLFRKPRGRNLGLLTPLMISAMSSMGSGSRGSGGSSFGGGGGIGSSSFSGGGGSFGGGGASGSW